MKKCNYQGLEMNVVSEDTVNGYLTLEGHGMKLRVTTEEVILEEPKEEELAKTIPPTNEIVAPTEDILPDKNAVLPKDLHESPTDLEAGLDSTQTPLDLEAGIDTPPSTTEVAPIAEVTTENPDMPQLGLDLSVLTADERHKENAKRRKDALMEFKSKIQKMLEELDDHIATSTPSGEVVTPMTEDDGAGGVVTTGTGTQTSGIANYNARLGTSPVKRKDTTGM